jgi:surface protein
MKKGTTLLRTLLLVLLSTMLGTMSVSAQEAYAVYTSNNTTLTFYYDSDRNTHTLSTETVYNLPTGNTQPAWYTDGTYANVTKVSFTSSFSSARPTSTSYWFYHMSNLTSISNLSYLNTSSVTSMNQMFAYCSGLTSLNLSNFDTGKVTTMQSMFWECTGLTSINMNNFNTEKVTTMYGMFKGCSALTTLDIRYFKTPVLANIQEMFYQCSNLTTIYAGHGWTYSGTDNQVFNNSTKLVGGEGTKYNPSYLGATYARVDGGTSSPGYFTRVPYVVWDSSAKSLTFYDDGKGSEKTGVIYYLNDPSTRPGWSTNDDHTNYEVTKVVFDPSFANARPTSTYLWFAGMDKLTSITSIAYLNTSEVTNMSYMFSGTKLSSLSLSKFDTSKATNMDHMFYRCTGLTKLDLTKFKTSKVTNMANMFDGDTNLQTILVTEGWWTTSKVTSSTNMFNECTSIVGGAGTAYDAGHVDKAYAKVDYAYDPGDGGSVQTATPGYLTSYQEYAVGDGNTLTFYYDTNGYKKAKNGADLYIGRVYSECEWTYVNNYQHIVFDSSFANNVIAGAWYIDFSCPNLETITGLENVKTANITQMSSMFSGLSKLQTLDLSSFDTRKVTNMDHMFHNCSSLTTIIVGANWSTANVTSSTQMFYNCTSLVGGAGTTYSSSHIDVAYAHPDEGQSNPGYLTGKLECYTVLNGNTLTFYNDEFRSMRTGSTFAVPNRTYVTPGWKNYASTIRTVIFDSSFATALPVSSYLWFGDCSNLEEIQGLENLNTSSMTQMTLMFSRCTKLVSLDLSHFDTSNVTSMDYMFDSCTKLKDVNLTSFDTKKLESTGYMFKNCISLEVLDLSSFTMGSIIVSAEGMFDGCSKLKTIYVNSAWDNSTWIYKGNLMFRGCTSLVGGAGTSWSESYINADFACIDRCPPSYNLGYMTLKPEGYAFFSTSNNTLTFYCDDQLFKRTGGTAYSLNVGSNDPGWSAIASQVNKVVLDASFADARPTTIYKWFDRMSNLTEITDMKYLNTSEVTNMDFLFSGCQKLASVDLSRFDTRKVTTMSMIFDKCWELKTLDVSSFNTENVKDFSWMFNDCNQLKVIDLTGFDTRSGTCTNGMFSQCSSLTTIYVGDAWKMDNIHDSSQMFQGCSSSLMGGYGTIWSESHIDGEYARIDGGPSSSTPGYFTSDPGYAVYDAESKKMTFYCDGRKAEKTGMKFSLNTPGTQPMWLQNGICDEVTKVVFDGSFGRAYPKTTAHWFRSMDQLSSIEDLQILNTRLVTSMDHMFAYCEKLTSIDVSHFDTRNVTSMASTFEDCRRVKSLDLSNFDTSNVNTMYCMFRLCYWLDDVNLSSFNTENVTNMTNMFYACGKLTTLNLASFNTSNVTYSQSMFEDCTELTTIYVSRLWDMSSCYGPYMFLKCPKLKGGAGTVWASTNSNDNTYAHIDGGTSNPGYLTQAPAEAYVIYTESDHTLTFYYDRARYVRTGKSFTLNSGNSTPGWYSAGLSGNTTRVVFDSSFADARPTTTKDWFVAMFDLTSIEGMENLNTSEVTNMKGMFSLCRNLESVDVSGFDTQKVTTTNGLFNECNSLQSVDLSGFNTINVTDMQQMFYGCTSLTTLDLTSFNTENVTLTPWMFKGCDHLKTVYVSDGFKVENVGQHTGMFEDCTSIVGGNGTTYDASHINKEYAIIDGLNGNPGYFTAKPYAVYDLDTQLLTLYNDGKPNEKTGKKFYLNAGNSMPGWVEVRTDIKKVIFHESFASARPTSTYYWFGEMPSLQEIEGLELLNTSEVTNMEAMFGNCHIAGELDLSHFDTHKVTSMKSMFWGCQNITTIYVSNAWNTNNVTDGWGMFFNCRNLVGGMGTEWKEDNYDYQDLVYAHIDGGTSNPGYLTLAPTVPYAVLANNTLTFYSDGKPNEKEGVVYCLPEPNAVPGYTNYIFTKVVFDSSFASARPTSTNNWFIGCNNMAEIEGLENLNTSEVTDMSCMFAGCTSLTTLDLYHFNTQKVTNMSEMFNICSSLKTIYVGDGWSTSSLTNNNNLFNGCTSLVGGAGTVFDPYHIGADYAHIDGGTSNPGYFTQGPAYALIGDVNGDKKVNVADVTALVNMLKSGNVVYNEVADVDGDGNITDFDVKTLVYNILGSYALMYVEDVFTITGRGTVATGQILKGMFHTGQPAVLRSISDAIADVEFTISGIEKFQQTVDVAVAGDNVGILVPVDKANVQRGDVLTIKNNPELRHGKTVKGTLYVLTKEEGGRHTPFFTGYRPQMYVAGADFTVECTDLGMVNGSTPEKIMPGDTSENIVFEVVQEDGKTPYVYPGQVVLLREGGRTVGRLTITE